jgi:UDP-N-acetylglucosamine transferase subunit ALG13
MKSPGTRPRILVTPLNWGLGHATRCIPMIRVLEQTATVMLASDGEALDLLRAEFPHLPAFELPAYKVRYGPGNLIWNVAKQTPRILYAIVAEYQATQQLVRTHQIDGILSDNRYGCRSPKANSVIMTHQLHLNIPNRIVKKGTDKLLQQIMAPFDAIWIPDVESTPNLSGGISHGTPVHPVTRFTGILTRMKAAPAPKQYDVAVVLSGPEPQRSILEQKLMDEALNLPLKFLFVRGKTNLQQQYKPADHITVTSYLTSTALNDVMNASDYIVCRSGYSTLMDLAAIGKKAILIPTPGQPEQEDLAAELAAQGMFVAQQQDHINLKEGLEVINQTTGIPPGMFQKDAYVKILDAWVNTLSPN